MLIPLKSLIEKYALKITGLIQCGAHWGEEHGDFIMHDIRNLVYIEPCSKAFHNLQARFRHEENIKLFNIAAGASIFETEINVETVNQGQSNSILKPKGHLRQHPSIKFHATEEITVVPLDSLGLDMSRYNFLMMDVQGYELEILKGATETLKSIDYIYTEVNKGEVYEGCAKIWEIDDYLTDFDRVETADWVGDWSDAFYIRKEIKSK